MIPECLKCGDGDRASVGPLLLHPVSPDDLVPAKYEDGEFVAAVGVPCHRLVCLILARHHIINEISRGGSGAIGDTKIAAATTWMCVIMPHASASVNEMVALSGTVKVLVSVGNGAAPHPTTRACLTVRAARIFRKAMVCWLSVKSCTPVVSYSQSYMRNWIPRRRQGHNNEESSRYQGRGAVQGFLQRH